MALKNISELPLDERPSYKIEQYPEAMSSRELLALLVGGDNQMEIADNLYQSCSGDLRRLGQENILEDIAGIGKATADRIMSAVHLGRKMSGPQIVRRMRPTWFSTRCPPWSRKSCG